MSLLQNYWYRTKLVTSFQKELNKVTHTFFLLLYKFSHISLVLKRLTLSYKKKHALIVITRLGSIGHTG